MENDQGIRDVNGLIMEIERVKEFTDKIYIYGAGLYARNIYEVLNSRGQSISGFIVTFQERQKELYGYSIIKADEVLCDDIAIIIGVNSRNRGEVMEYLCSRNFDKKRIIQGTDFLEKDAVRYDNTPVMEITTRIGCAIDCRYCPQSLLLKKYYADNPDREAIMSLATFETCLNKLPQNTRIVFSGMSEPFLNPQCVQMIRMAYESGRRLDLYTTMVGLNKKLLLEIVDIPFEYVTLHVADQFGYAHIPTNEEYYELVEYIINLKRKDGTAFISMCNAQAEPDRRVAEICKNKYEIYTTLLDRAGNLDDDELYSKQTLSGEISCSLCGQALNRNVLLPDGTVVLCCMDFGMKHIMGNLLNDSYEKVVRGNEYTKIKQGMKNNSSLDILCRRCTCANGVVS